MQPIETRYHGHRFRSRLEARWAVFFDALGIKWVYEKEGYDLGEGGGAYLPDFWLPESQVYAEVKGQEFTVKEVNRCRILAQKSSYPVVMLPRVPEASAYYAEMPNGLLGTHEWQADAYTLTLAVDRARTARFEHGETPSHERIEAPVPRAARTRGNERGASAERELVRAFLFDRSRVEQIAEKLTAESFREPQYRTIYTAFLAADTDATLEQVTAGLDRDAVQAMEDILAEGSYQIDPERTVSDSMATLHARNLDRRAAELDRLIPLATQPEKDKLIAEKEAVRSELKATGRNFFRKFRRSGR